MMDEQILRIFKARSGQHISGEELSVTLKVTRTAIWKHIEKLRKEGYTINAVPHLGYRMVSAPDKMLNVELQWDLSTKIIGRGIQCHDSLDSTNTYAYRSAEEGLEEGSVIFAESQTGGKGRLGRHWISPKKVGIYLSCVLRPRILPQEVSKITLAVAVAAARAIRQNSGLETLIRWPNDILVNNKKVCGILTEMKAEQDKVDFVVVGIGVNVNTSKRDLPPEASSLKAELGKKVSRIALARELLQQLDHWYLTLVKDGFGPIIEEWHNCSGALGSRVKVMCHNRELEGQVQDVDKDGALIVRLDNGFQERILAGDVRLLRQNAG